MRDKRDEGCCTVMEMIGDCQKKKDVVEKYGEQKFSREYFNHLEPDGDFILKFTEMMVRPSIDTDQYKFTMLEHWKYKVQNERRRGQGILD
jgi:hypothetical protein